jgi:phage terminase large subunit
MLADPTRVVCLREVQNSIKDSVKQLLEDWIVRLGVGRDFDILTTEIRNKRNGSLCIFRGMNDQNNDTIKSLEGFDIAWWEEAQTASERSLQLLRPTLRKPGSQLWFTWNPRYRTDPVDIFLRQNPPEASIVVRANYTDNPFFPAELELERQIDKDRDEEIYRHVWLGDYEKVGDQQFIPAGIVERAMSADVTANRFDEVTMGVDVARYGDDETVFVIRTGRDAKSIEWKSYKHLDTMEVAARVAAVMDEYKPDAVFVDETGVGAGVVDRLRQLGRRITPVNFGAKPDGLTRVKVANKRAEMWQRMKEWLAQGGVSLPNDMKLEAQLTGVQYKHDQNNAILLEKKEDMRKRGVPSPDRADALALTFAYSVVKQGYEEQDEEPEYGRSSATGY